MIDFYENVLLVLAVPAEFDDNAIQIMRECAYIAELINDKNSTNLQFITERKYLHNYNLFKLYFLLDY